MNEPLPKLYRARLKTYTIIKCAEPTVAHEPVTHAAEAMKYLLPLFKDMDCCRENFGAIFVDQKNILIAGKILFSGAISEVAVHPYEIVRAALLLGATGVVAAHNHPSGNLQPSTEDRAMTLTLTSALKTLGIRFLDHLVLSIEDGRFVSIVNGSNF